MLLVILPKYTFCTLHNYAMMGSETNKRLFAVILAVDICSGTSSTQLCSSCSSKMCMDKTIIVETNSRTKIIVVRELVSTTVGTEYSKMNVFY